MGDKKIMILLLAAGASSRMGVPKQLLPWKHGTLLNHAVAQAKKVSNRVVVVLGAHAKEIKKTLPETVETIINENWEKGLGCSIAHGVRYVVDNFDVDGLLIMLADQPLLGHGHLIELTTTFKRENKTTATQYDKGLGVPAVFHNSLFDQLLELNADFGAKRILEKNAEQLEVVAPKGKAVDIDTLETYHKLYHEHGQKT
ncbi:NTP transferase domain-containing protein [Allomuricauda sp. SCSIO 65647]|uniref:nucleotidyltransferase family protein n=1 Tax=Allomuricauda sp. SCSIO 65647 TaxID=2908843 RepID=UPI001F3D0438|nr:nucleotidyltransferase family protein [Muricauda sp. SCSIO 65647]UJH67314.1 nucleotidyltransferase family protein [Muricauda sp. SCSIO 65647]